MSANIGHREVIQVIYRSKEGCKEVKITHTFPVTPNIGHREVQTKVIQEVKGYTEVETTPHVCKNTKVIEKSHRGLGSYKGHTEIKTGQIC